MADASHGNSSDQCSYLRICRFGVSSSCSVFTSQGESELIVHAPEPPMSCAPTGSRPPSCLELLAQGSQGALQCNLPFFVHFLAGSAVTLQENGIRCKGLRD